jgi:hypothetical protein
MEPHLDRSDYWTRENTIDKGGTVGGTTGLDTLSDINGGQLTGGGTHQALCSY